MSKKFYILIGALILMTHVSAVSSQAGTIAVTNTNNSGAGSLRQAVFDAQVNANADDTIIFNANVRGVILLTSIEIELYKSINNNLTIIGPGANLLSIESNYAFRIFRAQQGNIKISGLRISRGYDSGNQGGGVFVNEDTNLSIDNSLITENTGAGVFTMSGSTLTVNNSTISGNDAGGIFGAGGLNMSNSTVAENDGDDGGGISWLNGIVKMKNVTVSGNQGIDSGGITFNTSVATILNCTIVGNTGANAVPQHTGGLRIINAATVDLNNTIIANNNAFTPNVGGIINSQGNNLIGDTTGGSGFIASDLLNVANPQLGGFANNGGATYTVSLLTGSPAINAGNNTGAPATDQRGVARPQGGAVDIGAYESGVRPAAFGKIVFVRSGLPGLDIFSMNADGSNQLQLTNNSFFDSQPKWSPDGSKIVFISNRDGGLALTEIYTMNADGSSATRMTNGVVSNEDPAWSPDGTKIAFDKSGQIFVMNATPLAVASQLTSSSYTGDKAHPSWSPDGSQIVFHNNRGFGDFRIESVASSCVNCTGGQSLANDLAPDKFDPVWSPDGNTLAFSNDPTDFNDHSDPYTFLLSPHFDSSNFPSRPLLTSGNPRAFSPAWSPDGTKLVYLGNISGLSTINADGSNPTSLGVSGNNSLPDWFGFNTPAGANVNAVSGTVSLIFSSITGAGTTNAVPIDPTTAGTLPGGYSLGAGYPAYEITTTASYTAPITVCLQVPNVPDLIIFNALTLFHSESGVLIDRTSSRNFATKTICASVTSLSPFAVAESLAPSAANVSVGGRVLTSSGRGVFRAQVSITNQNGETLSALTNSFGYFRFDEIHVGETYTISAGHKVYQFDSQIIPVFDEIRDINFIGQSGFKE